jgi:hypothetical protein
LTFSLGFCSSFSFLSQASFLPTEAVGRTYFRQLEHFLLGGLAGSLKIRLQPEVARLVLHNQQVYGGSAEAEVKVNLEIKEY